MESGLSGDQRVAIVECIENYIGDWACPDPYDAADFIAARVLEITRAPSDAALVEALEEQTLAVKAFMRAADSGRVLVGTSNRLEAANNAARAALAAAKGQQP